LSHETLESSLQCSLSGNFTSGECTLRRLWLGGASRPLMLPLGGVSLEKLARLGSSGGSDKARFPLSSFTATFRGRGDLDVGGKTLRRSRENSSVLLAFSCTIFIAAWAVKSLSWGPESGLEAHQQLGGVRRARGRLELKGVPHKCSLDFSNWNRGDGGNNFSVVFMVRAKVNLRVPFR
jgi:hypothetical protein